MKPFTDLRRYLQERFGMGNYKVRSSGSVEVFDKVSRSWKLYGEAGVDEKGEFCALSPWAKSVEGTGATGSRLDWRSP